MITEVIGRPIVCVVKSDWYQLLCGVRQMEKAKRYISGAIAIVILFSLLSVSVTASGKKLCEKYNANITQYNPEDFAVITEHRYLYTMNEYQEKGYKPADILPVAISAGENVKAGKDTPVTVKDFKGSTGISVLSDKSTEYLEWQISAPADGLYEIALEYYIEPGDNQNPLRKLYIDGESPFAEADSLTFPRIFTDESKQPEYDSNNDQVRPLQLEIPMWSTMGLRDNMGLYSSPFSFYLTQGEHTLRLEYLNTDMYIGSIILRSPEQPKSYGQISAEYESRGYKPAGQKGIIFQCENTVSSKNDSILAPVSNSDPNTVPSSVTYKRLNCMGDWTWRKGGQEITWEFTAEEDGLYNIGFRFANWYGVGIPTYRRITIDGEVPYKELLNYPFNSTKTWEFEALGKEKPYNFYLKAGKHSISMMVVMEPITETLFSIYNDMNLISETYRKIVMITGENPDVNYQYEIEKKIPNILETIKKISQSVKQKADYLVKLSGKTQAVSSAFYTIVEQFDLMAAKPEKIPRQIQDFTNAQSILGAWYIALQDMPLIMDYYAVGSDVLSVGKGKASFLQQFTSFFIQFIFSFVKDYSRIEVTTGESGHNIEVWLSMGSEWASIVKNHVSSSFTRKKGIGVKINVLPANSLGTGTGDSGTGINALILAVNSGRAPDMVCGLPPSTPVDYAIRKGAADLKQFDDFDEVSKSFLDKCLIPFGYQGGCYALPETMNFTVMFYRKDILKELKLSLPNTFRELYDTVLPVLSQNNMNFYCPQDYTMFLFQKGGKYYTEDGFRSALDSKEAYEAMKEMCDLYTAYGVPVQSDFFNRFRDGVNPIGIATFAEYVRLSAAAPDIAGKWGITPVPGHETEDGETDHSIGGIASSAAMILEQSENKKDAWEYLKWWTSAEVQKSYSNEVERSIGTDARWCTANLDAFLSLPWDKNDLNVITEQWKWANETPNVLGGYYTSRYVGYCFNNVIVNNMSVRDALELAVKNINKEMVKKQIEYKINVPDKYSKQEGS